MSTTLLEGHVVDVLAALPARHFHTVVTSPPYWQLRAYGTPPQTWPDGWVGELGQEPTPELYVAHLVACFAAVRRVLRDDGILWVNLAGSYWSEPGGQNGAQGTVSPKAVQANAENGRQKRGQHPVYKGLDWVDVPGLFARAMQAAGWRWRSDVVWVKPSALPESVQGTRWERCRVSLKAAARQKDGRGGANPAHEQRPGNFRNETETTRGTMAEWADCPGCPRCAQTDGLVLRRGSGRPTKATERVLLFSKRQGYFFDQEAVREEESESVKERAYLGKRALSPRQEARIELGFHGQTDSLQDFSRTGRNLRDYWIMAPEPLKDAHYAAFPSALPERCIKAGTSEWGCCPGCGAPWARVVSTTYEKGYRTGHLGFAMKGDTSGMVDRSDYPALDRIATTLGWRPTCRCPDSGPPVPARVLDCFGGSGTTALAANRLGRDCTLIELKPAYAALARKRVGREPLSLFATHGDGGGVAPQGILPVEEAEGAVAGG